MLMVRLNASRCGATIDPATISVWRGTWSNNWRAWYAVIELKSTEVSVNTLERKEVSLAVRVVSISSAADVMTNAKEAHMPWKPNLRRRYLKYTWSDDVGGSFWSNRHMMLQYCHSAKLRAHLIICEFVTTHGGLSTWQNESSSISNQNSNDVIVITLRIWWNHYSIQGFPELNSAEK